MDIYTGFMMLCCLIHKMVVNSQTLSDVYVRGKKRGIQRYVITRNFFICILHQKSLPMNQI